MPIGLMCASPGLKTLTAERSHCLGRTTPGPLHVRRPRPARAAGVFNRLVVLVLHQDAPIHHDLQPGGTCAFGLGIVDQTQLHPDGFMPVSSLMTLRLMPVAVWVAVFFSAGVLQLRLPAASITS